MNSDSEKEMRKAEDQINAFENQIKDLTMDRMNAAPKEETEQQTKLSNREAKKADAPYIKPVRSIQAREKFNEKFRKAHEIAWEYVRCIVENNEIIGEAVECWTKRFPGDPAHFWKVPTNKPVYIPKLLAEQLSQCRYHRLTMEANQNQVTGSDGMATYIGNMVVDNTKQRIDCRPVGFGLNSFTI